MSYKENYENCPDCVQNAPDCQHCFDNPQRHKTAEERIYYKLFFKCKQLLKNDFARLERVDTDKVFKIYTNTNVTVIKEIEKFNFFIYLDKENLTFSYLVKEVGFHNGGLFVIIEREIF